MVAWGQIEMEEVEVVILRYSMELRSPGCTHFVLECVAAEPPYLLENRSSQPLRYRQAGVPGLPFQDLPPLSAAGFAWQVPGQSARDQGRIRPAGSNQPCSIR